LYSASHNPKPPRPAHLALFSFSHGDGGSSALDGSGIGQQSNLGWGLDAGCKEEGESGRETRAGVGQQVDNSQAT